MMNKIKKEIHLFIIWEKARYKQDLILEDLNNKFSIIDVKEITWSKFYFSSNLTRFYGENLPKGSHKENHCGNGSFLAIIVEDLGPRYNERLTTKGLEKVNINSIADSLCSPLHMPYSFSVAKKVIDYIVTVKDS